VVLDTSGSISKNELTEFISELQTLEYIVPEYTVMTADAKVHEIVKVKDLKELVSKIKFEGGGGTDFRDVFQKVKKCNVMIFFTDGYTTYPENPPGYPVLWILTKSNEKPPWGIVAHILDD
jgi:predicted metal-dependent peptidase